MQPLSFFRGENPSLLSQECCSSDTTKKIKEYVWEFFSSLLLLPSLPLLLADSFTSYPLFYQFATVLDCRSAVYIYFYLSTSIKDPKEHSHPYIQIARSHKRDAIVDFLQKRGFEEIHPSNKLVEITKASSQKKTELPQQKKEDSIQTKILAACKKCDVNELEQCLTAQETVRFLHVQAVLESDGSPEQKKELLQRLAGHGKVEPFTLEMSRKFFLQSCERNVQQCISHLPKFIKEREMQNVIDHLLEDKNIREQQEKAIGFFLEGISPPHSHIDLFCCMTFAARHGLFSLIPKAALLGGKGFRLDATESELFLEKLTEPNKSDDEIVELLTTLGEIVRYDFRSSLKFFFTFLKRNNYKTVNYLLCHHIDISRHDAKKSFVRNCRRLHKEDVKALTTLLISAAKNQHFKKMLFEIHEYSWMDYSEIAVFLSKLREVACLFFSSAIQCSDPKIKELHKKIMELFLSQVKPNERKTKILDILTYLKKHQISLKASIQSIPNHSKIVLFQLVQSALACQKLRFSQDFLTKVLSNSEFSNNTGIVAAFAELYPFMENLTEETVDELQIEEVETKEFLIKLVKNLHSLFKDVQNEDRKALQDFREILSLFKNKDEILRVLFQEDRLHLKQLEYVFPPLQILSNHLTKIVSDASDQ